MHNGASNPRTSSLGRSGEEPIKPKRAAPISKGECNCNAKTLVRYWHDPRNLPEDVRTAFYADAEAVLAKLPRRGIPMILRQMKKDAAKPYSFSGMQKIVHKMRDKLGLPSIFTLDACRHGGMTELEEAELTDGQGRALSGHKTRQSYAGYAKQTIERALAATRVRKPDSATISRHKSRVVFSSSTMMVLIGILPLSPICSAGLQPGIFDFNMDAAVEYKHGSSPRQL